MKRVMPTFKLPCTPQTILRAMQGTPDERIKKFSDLYKVRATRSERYPNLVQFRYDQFESDMAHPCVQQCRGLILDTEDNWGIVAYPFNKFFNLGETLAADLDWKTAIAYEKLDGSLIMLYWYANQWNAATIGNPDAAGSVGPKWQNTSFERIFWWLWKNRDYLEPGAQWHHVTFMFELCTSFNRIVCNYGKNRLIFLGARSTLDGSEFAVDEFPYLPHNWEGVKQFPLHTLEDIRSSFEHLDPLKQEGYVVMDNDFRRLKVKHPGYVALHKLRENGGYTPKRILECIFENKTDDIVAAFPEWKEDFDAYTHAIASFIGELEDEYRTLRHKYPLVATDSDRARVVQKAFAIEAVRTRCPAAMFAVRNGKTANVRTFVRMMNPESLLILLGRIS